MTRQTLGDVLLAVFCVAAVMLAIMLGGCARTRPFSIEPSTRLPARVQVAIAADPVLEAQCQRMNRTVMGFTATSIGLGVAGGANGLASIFTSSTERTATAATGVSVAILSAVFTYLSNAEAAAYTRACTAGATGAP